MAMSIMKPWFLGKVLDRRETIRSIRRRSTKRDSLTPNCITTRTRKDSILSDRDLGALDTEARKADQKKRTFTLGFLRRRHTDSALASKLGHHSGEKGGRSSGGPSPEALVQWSKSFSSLLRDKDGLNLFQEFLRSEFSQENIEFWITCEEYKSLKSEQLEANARRIFDDFIAENAPQQINLNADMRRSVALSMNSIDRRTFENAQRRIQALMAKDSYPRFLESRFYTDLVGHRKH